jgi:hypothetical protein
MAYTPITSYPSDTVLSVFMWQTPTVINPRLAAPITAADTTIYFTDAPKDYLGAVVSKGFLMGIKNLTTGVVELVYVAAGKVQADGLSAIDCVRGIRHDGLDFTTGDATLAIDHPQDSTVFCSVAPFYHRAMIAALNGTVASGGNTWKVGDGTDSDIKIYGANDHADQPWWGYDKATSAWVYSNNGVASTPFGTGAGVTGGDGITVTAGDIDIDLTDTVIFKATTAGAGDAGKAVALNAAGLVNQSIVETLKDVTSTSTELNKLAGAGAGVTAANLTTLTAGATSDANALHTHTKTNVGTTSRAAATASGNEVIAHGLGVTPKMIIFTSQGTSTAAYPVMSTFYCDQNRDCSGTYHDGTGGATVTSYAVLISNGSGDYQAATVSAMDATNFTLAWTKHDSGYAANVAWIAIA